MCYKILIPQDISAPGKDLLREQGYTVAIGSSYEHSVLCQEIADCDAVLVRAATRMNKQVIDSAPRLRVIGRFGVGFDNIDVDYATERGVWVTITPEANAQSVAEHAMMMMLALARHSQSISRSFRAGDWAVRDRLLARDLQACTLGLLGLGRIGRAVAHIAQDGFGMRVLGYDPFITAENCPPGLTLMPEMEAIFIQADFVSLHLPVTAQTRDLVDQRLLSLMKPEAYLINVSRGELVNEAALLAALRQGLLAGAGLDVFRAEPPAPDDPLLHLDNVIVSPHNAGLSANAMNRMGLDAAQGIIDVLQGRRPQWPVNEIV